MNDHFSNPRPLKAVLSREFRGALMNRYFQVFATLALLGGLSAATFAEGAEASAFFILQIVLYFVSLFALLVGVTAARAESEEWPQLFSQPVPRFAFVAGKFCAFWAIFAAVLLPLFVPALCIGAAPRQIAPLYAQSLGLAACFGSLGLGAGFAARDRVQGLVFGVGAWLTLLFGIDLIALFAAHWPAFQKLPGLWVAGLMLNPLDAFRIDALFSMEQIPAEAASKAGLAHWWIAHTGLWFALLCTGWTATLLLFAGRRLSLWED